MFLNSYFYNIIQNGTLHNLQVKYAYIIILQSETTIVIKNHTHCSNLVCNQRGNLSRNLFGEGLLAACDEEHVIKEDDVHLHGLAVLHHRQGTLHQDLPEELVEHRESPWNKVDLNHRSWEGRERF